MVNGRWKDSYPALIDEVLARSTRPHSIDHGTHHWQLVAVSGASLLPLVPQADPDVVFCFALLHDSMRENDYVDPGHGKRGGALAHELVGGRRLLDDEQLEALVYACDHHTAAHGTGKTFAVRALAWEWREWCSIEYIADPDKFFSNAEYMLDVLLDEDAPERNGDAWRLLILEDAGEMLMPDARREMGQGLSRLLNIVDGLIGQGLRVMVLITTNEGIQRLHPAVARPGRCASRVDFPVFDMHEASAWLERQSCARPVQHPMSLADLYAVYEDYAFTPERSRKVGFVSS